MVSRFNEYLENRHAQKGEEYENCATHYFLTVEPNWVWRKWSKGRVFLKRCYMIYESLLMSILFIKLFRPTCTRHRKAAIKRVAEGDLYNVCDV